MFKVGLTVSKDLSFLDIVAKLTYKRDEMELIILRQLENLDALSEQVKLLKKQNELLLKANHKLTEELSEERKTIKPYPTRKRTRNPKA